MPRYGERKGFGPGEDVSATEHERIRKDLAGLIADPRYRHDEAFKRHVRRQFQRIYNDPRNPKATLRIGVPKVFAKEVEPFDPVRFSQATVRGDSAARMQTGGFVAAASTTPSASGGSLRPGGEGKSASKRHEGNKDAMPSPDAATDEQDWMVRRIEQAEQLPPGPDRDKARSALKSLDTFLGTYNTLGWTTAAQLLQHFVEGSGTPVTVEPAYLANYGPAQDSGDTVVGYFRDWLLGERADSQFGSPTLSMHDGERIVIGGDASGPSEELSERMHWEAAFRGVGDEMASGKFGNILDLLAQQQASIGGGSTDGYGHLVLERRGDEIAVEGFIDFQITDRYDFATDDWNPGYHTLQRLGLAVPFDIATPLWRRTFRATVRLVNGRPVSVDHAISGTF